MTGFLHFPHHHDISNINTHDLYCKYRIFSHSKFKIYPESIHSHWRKKAPQCLFVTDTITLLQCISILYMCYFFYNRRDCYIIELSRTCMLLPYLMHRYFMTLFGIWHEILNHWLLHSMLIMIYVGYWSSIQFVYQLVTCQLPNPAPILHSS